MNANRFNQNLGELKLQSYITDGSVAGSLRELPIAGDYLELDPQSNVALYLDLSGSGNLQSGGGGVSTITLYPGDSIAVPFSRPKGTWMATNNAIVKINYGTYAPIFRKPVDPVNISNSVTSLSTFNFVAVNQVTLFTSTLSYLRGGIVDYRLSVAYSIPTVDTLQSLLCFEIADSVNFANRKILNGQNCIVATAAGWDVVYDGSVIWKSFGQGLAEFAARQFVAVARPLNNAAITRSGAFSFSVGNL